VADELVDTDIESQFPAAQEQYNTAPIVLSRIGTYVRSTATGSGVVGSTDWVNALVNNTTNPSFSFSGVVSEIIVFDRKLSAEERDDVYAYLSLKYGMENTLPEAMQSARNSASSYGRTAAYWVIESHPNRKNLQTLPYGSEFGGMTLSEFFEIPDLVYKSAGTRLANGTTLAGDTYSNIGS
jgi:hypothetical protein